MAKEMESELNITCEHSYSYNSAFFSSETYKVGMRTKCVIR